ncbi:MAG: Hpt domain-containing protein [Spirochaetes bacterium]|nr:Hpt domain-containing protein [Spirochaetota bacterium]
MIMIQLPELIGKILQDLSIVGIQPTAEHTYTDPARNCTIHDPDRIRKVLTVFFIQLESALQGRSCTLHWDYREGTLHATLPTSLPPEQESVITRTRVSLQCLGGTLTLEQQGYFLTLPIEPSSNDILRAPLEAPFREFPKNSIGYMSKDDQLIFNPAVLQQACPDEEFSHQLFEEFLLRCKDLLVELEHQITLGEDLVKIHRIAHSIKGGGLNVGAFRLAEVARWIEQQAKAGSTEGLQKALKYLKDEERLLESVFRDYYG